MKFIVMYVSNSDDNTTFIPIVHVKMIKHTESLPLFIPRVLEEDISELITLGISNEKRRST